MEYDKPIKKFKNKLQTGLVGEKQAERFKKIYKQKKAESDFKLKELKEKNKATLLKAREAVMRENLLRRILKRKGLLGLGAALVGAGMDAKKAYEEKE